MNKLSSILSVFVVISFFTVEAQKTPTGNPADFKVKTCLHSLG